jgi:putative aldouronate transport system permease protein
MSSALAQIPPLMAKRQSLWREIWKKREFYLFVLPGLIYFIVIRYFPLYFIQVAFRHYKITRSIADSPWAGLTYFQQVFTSLDFMVALKNTVVISTYNLVFGFPAPLILALMLNEVRNTAFKRATQTVVYLPHFVSWVVIGGILRNFMSIQGGVLNSLLGFFGVEPVPFLINPAYFRGILVVSSIWKEVGWGTIIYLATMSGINPELYESARIDGASRPQQIWHITIPSIMYVVVVLLIIRLGNVLNTGFEQILVLYNQLLRDKGLVLDYYVWINGLVAYRYSFAAAAGVFNTVVAFVMVFTADRLAKRLGQRGIF